MSTSTTELLLTAVQGVYSFAVVMGITTGGFFAFAILILRHRRAKAYDLYSER